MSDILDLSPTASPGLSKYEMIGLPRNPFAAQDNEGMLGPMYTGHLKTVLTGLQQWLVSGFTGFVSPISIKGSIGVGKTRLLLQIQTQINKIGSDQLVYAAYARLDKTGYSRPSVGQMVLEALEDIQFSGLMQKVPEGIIPVLWAGIVSTNNKAISGSRMADVITRLRTAKGFDQIERARLVCRWLHRDTLTASQSERVGLYGRVDYEGQLPEILADLLRCLRELGVLNQLYFMVDQLEDVFRPSYSELRRSRILTDLRSLIDEIDRKCPIALVLAWSPEVDDPRSYTMRGTDAYLNREYAALYSRLTRNMLVIEKLDQFHATGFADVYLKAVSELPGYDAALSSKAAELAIAAWKRLDREKKAVDNRTTPRDLLTALYQTVEDLANQRNS